MLAKIIKNVFGLLLFGGGAHFMVVVLRWRSEAIEHGTYYTDPLGGLYVIAGIISFFMIIAGIGMLSLFNRKNSNTAEAVVRWTVRSTSTGALSALFIIVV